MRKVKGGGARVSARAITTSRRRAHAPDFHSRACASCAAHFADTARASASAARPRTRLSALFSPPSRASAAPSRRPSSSACAPAAAAAAASACSRSYAASAAAAASALARARDAQRFSADRATAAACERAMSEAKFSSAFIAASAAGAPVRRFGDIGGGMDGSGAAIAEGGAATGCGGGAVTRAGWPIVARRLLPAAREAAPVDGARGRTCGGAAAAGAGARELGRMGKLTNVITKRNSLPTVVFGGLATAIRF